MYWRNEKNKLYKVITLFIFGVLSNFYYMLFSRNPVDVISNDQDITATMSDDSDEMLRGVNPTIQALALFLSNYIQQPLWSYTRVPAIRDLLYLMPHKFSAKKNGEFSVNFFYNEVHNMGITLGNLLKNDAIAHEEEILDLF
ncbi:MAG: hypothetical protein V1855_02570, partial [bacterium]